MPEDFRHSELDPASFRAIAALAYSESGLQLVSEKTSMIQSRLRHRLRALGMASFGEYVKLVCSETGKTERRQMISALTTNVSHFFRENHHFEILSEALMPKIIDEIREGKKLRIWSAGCANGQEAYSICMSLIERYPELEKLDFRILATDIDPHVVAFAAQGCYPGRLTSGIPKKLLKKYFAESKSGGESAFHVHAKLKSFVTFKELNLLAPWPMQQKMDAIFCRNVVIYFDGTTQQTLWPRFEQQLTEQGYLFLGHSERINHPEIAGLTSCGPTTYRPARSLKSPSRLGV